MKNKIICQRKWLSTGHLDTRLAKSLFPCKFIVSFLQIKFPKYNVFPRLIKKKLHSLQKSDGSNFPFVLLFFALNNNCVTTYSNTHMTLYGCCLVFQTF